MKNKVLIELVVPELDKTFDLFIPVNELIWRIKKIMLRSISDLTNTSLDLDREYILMNVENSRMYTNNEAVIETDIRNGSTLLFISRV